MAGIAIVLDLLKRNHNFYSPQFSASAAVTVAAASAAAASSTPFASRFLFGHSRIPIAYCDAGVEWADEFAPKLQTVPTEISRTDALKFSTKEYYFELKPLFSAFEWRQLALTSLRSFLLFYLPLLEPSSSLVDDEDDFLQDAPEEHHVDLITPFHKSVKQIIRETSVVTTRRILERLAVHHASQRVAWKLLKDIPKSAMRKAERDLPTMVYIYRVGKTTFRGHFLGVAASWFVQVGIEVYRFFSRLLKTDEETTEIEKSEQLQILGKKLAGVTLRCGSALVFASIGAGVGACIIRPSRGQWIGCALGDLAGPIIVSVCLERYLQIEL